MFSTEAVNALPEVSSTVLGDREGTLLEALGDADPETTAAVSGFTVNHLAEAGGLLGLGELERLTAVGGQQTTVLQVSDEHVLAVRVDPRRPIVSVEKKIGAIIARGESS